MNLLVSVLLSLMCLTMLISSANADQSHLGSDATYLRMGLDLAARKYPEEAAVEFSKCKNFSTASAQQLNVISQTYFNIGESSPCLKVADYAIGQERVKQQKEILASLLVLRGNVLASQNSINLAVISYKLAAAADPKRAHLSLSKAGELLMNCKRYKEALPLIEKGINAGGMNGFIYQNIGHCYLELNEPAKAIAPLMKSIEVFVKFRKRQTEAFLPGLIQSHKYLIRAYQKTSNLDQARIWQKRLDALVGDLNHDFFGNR